MRQTGHAHAAAERRARAEQAESGRRRRIVGSTTSLESEFILPIRTSPNVGLETPT